MGAFDDAAEVIFADENLALDALWYTGGIGAGFAVRVLKAAPDETLQFGQSHVVASAPRIRVLKSAVAYPKKGDTVKTVLDGVTYEIASPPKLDTRRLVWTCDAVERP
jgi:hypothetical protein